MKARAEADATRHRLAGREIKRSPGGIRDVEFSVQLLQLVHGHHDPTIRNRSTLGALDRADGRRLREQRGRRRAGRLLPVPAHRRTPAPAGRGGADPRAAHRRRRPGAGWPACSASPTVPRPRPPPPSTTPCAAARATSASSTSVCSSVLCSRPSPPWRHPAAPCCPRARRRTTRPGASCRPTPWPAASAPSVSATPNAPGPRSRSWPAASPACRG